MEYRRPDTTKEEQRATELTLKRCEEFGIEPLALLLHGSRANGNSYEGSDWDIMVLVRAGVEEPDLFDFFVEDFGHLDTSVIQYLPKMDMKDYGKLFDLRPTLTLKTMWAKEKKYSDFVDSIKDYATTKLQGVQKGTKDYIKQRRLGTLFERAELRIVGCPDPLRRSVYIGRFLQSTFEAYFYYKNEYGRSISEAATTIETQDPELYKLLVKLPRLTSKRSLRKNLQGIRAYFEKLSKEYPGTKG